ncbi:myelin-associated glycoprotein-like [Engystomops pustulosus]|uniref:myelin-associated glycoprotein-like n=1 Tax=Engystomops pustulosus TaxID=76066 RepID=UPI003AFB6549
MDQKTTLFILFLLKGLLCTADQNHLTIPKSISTIKDSCVVIPCSYTYPNPKLSSGEISGIWYAAIDKLKGHIKFLSSTKPEDNPHFIGDLGTGNCSLIIHNVQPEDPKIYYFRVEMKHFKFSYSPTVTLNVLENPSCPTLVFPSQTIPEATKVSLSCSTHYTCSADVAVLVWSSQEGQVIVTRSYEGDGVWKVESKQTFNVSRNHDGMSIGCHASYSSGVKSQVMKANLSISYKPEILKESKCKKNGSAIYCECTAMAHPPASISWNSTGINVTETSGFSINSSSGYKAMSRLEGAAMSPGDLWCTAENMEGSVSQNLPVYEKPQILQESHCRKNLSGIYCECSAMANPPASITWSSTGINVTETSGFSIKSSSHGNKTVSSLESTVMSPADLWCTAENTEGSETHNFSVHVDWMKPALIGGGILAIIFGVASAIIVITKCRDNCRSKGKKTSNPNNYAIENIEHDKALRGNNRMMRNTGSIGDENVYKNISYENGNDDMNSDDYINVKEDGIYANY